MLNINEIKENFKRFTILLLRVVYYKYQIIWMMQNVHVKLSVKLSMIQNDNFSL